MDELDKEAFTKLKSMRDLYTSIIHREKKDEPIKETEELAQLLHDINELVKRIEADAHNESISLDENAKFNLLATQIKRSVENLITDFCAQEQAALLDLSYELLRLEKTDTG